MSGVGKEGGGKAHITEVGTQVTALVLVTSSSLHKASQTGKHNQPQFFPCASGVQDQGASESVSSEAPPLSSSGCLLWAGISFLTSVIA